VQDQGEHLLSQTLAELFLLGHEPLGAHPGSCVELGCIAASKSSMYCQTRLVTVAWNWSPFSV